jgi:hypothetical protein
MCNNCDDVYEKAARLDKRLDRELTPKEKQRAGAIAAERFPEIASTVRRRNTQMMLVAIVPVALIVGVIWWRGWRRTAEAS